MLLIFPMARDLSWWEIPDNAQHYGTGHRRFVRPQFKIFICGSLKTNMWFAFTLSSPIHESQAFTKHLFDNTLYLNIEVAQVFKSTLFLSSLS